MDQVELVEYSDSGDSSNDSAMSDLTYRPLLCEAEPAEPVDFASNVDLSQAEGLKQENCEVYQGGEISSSEIQAQEDPLGMNSSDLEETKSVVINLHGGKKQSDPLCGAQPNEAQLLTVPFLSGISAHAHGPEESSSSNSEAKITGNIPSFSGTSEGPIPIDLITPNFEGPCKFGIVFPDMENARTPSVYVSEQLNKVFLRMGSTIIVKFTFDPNHAPSTDLYVRAVLKFVDIDVIQFPVDRCKVHGLEDDPLNKAHEFEHLCKCPYYNLAGHVLRSSTQGAIYCYDPLTNRHSVMNPLKGRSHDVIYSLHCKSSCAKGIDRRPMQIVFTLELLNGVVLGQTSMNVKVCTSPKRDRDRCDAEIKNSVVKRRRVYYEKIQPKKNVMVTATSNGGIPCVSIVDVETDEQLASVSRKIREKIEDMKQQLMLANNTINRVLQALNDLE